jgi:hypothetical protein
MPTIEQKFDQKLAAPFYRDRITIKSRPFHRLRDIIERCAIRSTRPEELRRAVYTRVFLVLNLAGTSSAITSIIATQGHVRDFASRALDFLEYFYTLDCRRSITGMQHGRGMPTQKDITDLQAWCTPPGKTECDMELLRSITGMQHGRGMPTQKMIENYRCSKDQQAS